MGLGLLWMKLSRSKSGRNLITHQPELIEESSEQILSNQLSNRLCKRRRPRERK